MANTRKSPEGEPVGDDWGDLDYVPKPVESSRTPQKRNRKTTPLPKSVLAPGFTDATDDGQIPVEHRPIADNALTEDEKATNREFLRRLREGDTFEEIGQLTLPGVVEQEPVIDTQTEQEQ